MTTPIEQLAGLVVGAVESVSPDEIRVLLEPTTPHATALNTGIPTPFPRLNGYVLMPNEAGATVAQISWIGSQHSAYPKRSGATDAGIVDLPFPLRKMSVSPVGTLTSQSNPDSEIPKFELQRGVVAFPSVGDQVLMPTSHQVEAIVGGKASDRRVKIGTSPLAGNAAIMVDPDKLFGRHLAVLGNTGSGKSCTVAGLIRWSLESAGKVIASSNENTEATDQRVPNARFIVLDPNGEYVNAFQDLKIRRFQVDGSGDFKPLKVPAWLWNGDEWAAFTGAAPGVQRPILFDALRRLRSGAGEPDAFQTRVRGRVRRYRTSLRLKIHAGDHQRSGVREGVAQMLINMAEDFEPLRDEAEDGLREKLGAVVECAQAIEDDARSNANNRGGFWHNDFSEVRLGKVQDALERVADAVDLGDDEAIVGEDIPRFFSAKELPNFVQALAADASGRDISQFVDSLNLRIRGLFAAGALASVAAPGDAPSCTLEEWLTDHIGADGGSNGQIAVVDLSLVPSEAIHVVMAVLARMVFEAIQRYRRETGEEQPTLPTVLVLDEAHTFAHRDLTSDGASPAGRVCCRTLERIAREGRKFGLGLVLASQRPSEMSPTVLSQCNTFLLHRIVNDADQNLVGRLVPDNVRGLLRELPSLPSQQAVLLGWATPVPLLVEIGHLPEAQCPQSADPDFWDVWTLAKERKVNWRAVAKDWAGE